MRRWIRTGIRSKWKSFLLAGLAIVPAATAVEPNPGAVAGFNACIAHIEAGLAQQHLSAVLFVAPVDLARLRRGELVIEHITPPADLSVPGAMLHHWRGTAFVSGATVADFDRLLRDFRAYPAYFAPQIVSDRVLAQQDDQFQIGMRVRQKHIITVVLDIEYGVGFGSLDPAHHFSISRSTHIAEIDAPSTPNERKLSASEEHGFLWRLNSYWSYEERDGGLVIQIESVSLTRSIPTGLGWAVGPFVESVPRDSLEFTLRSAANALRNEKNKRGGPNHDR